jgi:hypothetical protein
MKSPVVFRAEFRQSRNVSIKLSAAITVEVYRAKIGPPGEWRARRPGTRIDFPAITPQSTAATLMRQIAHVHFQTQVSGWLAYDIQQDPPRLLLSEDFATDKDGRVYLTKSYREKLQQERTEKIQADIRERKQKALEGM